VGVDWVKAHPAPPRRTVSIEQAGRPAVVAPAAVPARASRRVALLLVALALALVGPVVTGYNAQPASRYALTAALAEHHTVDLGRYERILGVDHARYEGELRSDKPPGQPLLGVPVYLVGRWFGAEPAAQLRATGDLGLWWQTLWGAMVPFAITVALMFAMASRFAPRRAVAAALAIGFGTIMLPHAASLYGHALAGCLVFGAWCALDRGQGRHGHAPTLVLAGFLAAAAVAVEYHTAIVAVVLAVVAISRFHRRSLWCALGALPPATAAAIYHRAAFGHAWRLPYGYYAGKLGAVPTSEGGYSVPSPHAIVDVFTGHHGLLLVSPIVLVALAAAARLAREPGDLGTHARVALAVFVPYLLLVAGWSGTQYLEEPGPRYLVPALPFLAVPLATAWQRSERLRPFALAAAWWGAAVCVAGTVVYLFVAPGNAPFATYFGRVARLDFSPTIWGMSIGRAGVVAHLLTVVTAGGLLVRAARAHTNECSPLA
jgi:uncharacterized membrane protein